MKVLSKYLHINYVRSFQEICIKYFQEIFDRPRRPRLKPLFAMLWHEYESDSDEEIG